MVANDSEMQKEWEWLSTRPKSEARGKTMKECSQDEEGASAKPFLKALAKKEHEFYEGYFKIPPKPGKLPMSAKIAVATNQNPLRGFGSMSEGDRYLQCIIKNTGVMIWNRRSITPQEMLLYQQFPLRWWMTVPSSPRPRRCCSFTPIVPVQHKDTPVFDLMDVEEEVANEVTEPNRKRSAFAGQCGNSMNVAICHAIWILVFIFILVFNFQILFQESF